MTGDDLLRRVQRLKEKRLDWEDQAAENLERWGDQDVAILFLAMVEEMGEIASVLEDDIAPGTPDEDVAALRVLIQQMARLGEETRVRLEGAFEDDDGQPLPEAERLLVRQAVLKRGVSDVDDVQDELDDLAPLCYQLTWALNDERDSG